MSATHVAAKMIELTGFMLTAFWSSTSCKSVNICLIFKHELSKSKFVSHLSEEKKKF